MITAEEAADIEWRLRGKDHPVAADAPDEWFSAFLNFIHDHGSITFERAAREISFGSAERRVQRLWQDKGGVNGCIRDLLDLSECCGLTLQRESVWLPGPEMQDGKRVMICSPSSINPISGKASGDATHYTTKSAEQRAQENELSVIESDVAELQWAIRNGRSQEFRAIRARLSAKGVVPEEAPDGAITWRFG